MTILRWLPFATVSLSLYFLALDNDVYDVTSPPALSFHVFLRKFYSIIAFALVGLTYSFGRRRAGIIDAAAAIGLYSGLIEIGQWFTSQEALRWNLFDIGCGIVGGALGAAVFSRLIAVRVR